MQSWQHNTTKGQALEKIKDSLEKRGYSSYVEWDGYSVSASVLFLLNLKGIVTDYEIIIKRCNGPISKKVLNECHKIVL